MAAFFCGGVSVVQLVAPRMTCLRVVVVCWRKFLSL